MCVFSAASGLFMFPAMYLYYKPALELYRFEKADGIGSAYELVIQGFIRFASIAFIPVASAVAIIYLLVYNTNIIMLPPLPYWRKQAITLYSLQLVNSESYDVLVFLQVLVVNVALNQTWIALLIALVCGFPLDVAFRLSPVVSAIAGFTSGFFIPVGVLHWG